MIGMVRRAIRRRASGDEGVGLILVIGISVFVFLIAAAAVSMALNGITQSRNRQGFEKALATSEAGVNYTLGKLQASFSLAADYPVPSTSTVLDGTTSSCSSGPVGYPAAPSDGANGVWSSESAERAWATGVLLSEKSIPGCIHQGDQGEYIIFKPSSGANLKYGRVYAMTAMPSFANPQRTRVIKDEYIFMPYRPQFAVLTGGDLDISSSTTVTTAPGSDPSLAGVHSNGTITGSGNPTVSGPVTSTGTSTFSSNNFASGPTIAQLPAQQVPAISAYSLYLEAGLDTSPAGQAALADWYDLCPNGDVKVYSTGGPCTAPTAVTNVTVSGAFHGWTFSSSSRTWTAHSTVLSGTYFVDQANVTNGAGNATIPRLTVIASALAGASPWLANGDCTAKQYGNITWDHYAMSQTNFGGIWLYADTDLVTTANFTAGDLTVPNSGMFVAGDQIQMATSSQGAVGSVVAANQCPTPPPYGLITSSSVKNPAIYYDPNAPAAFTSVITTALWLDYSGS